VTLTWKVTSIPAIGELFAGCTVNTGGVPVEFTVSVAALEVVEPTEFVAVARYLLPLIESVVFGRVSTAEVAPLMLLHDVPLFVDNCH
jgi:hypothetical protein